MADMRQRDQRPTTISTRAVVDTLDRRRTENVADAFEEYSKLVKNTLSTEQIHELLEANGLDSSASDAAVLLRCQDLVFFGPLEKCPVCNGDNLEFTGYYCECGTCNIYRSKYPPRKRGPIKWPTSIFKQICPNYAQVGRVNLVLTVYQDGVEINGWRMSWRILSIYVVAVVFVLMICFCIRVL